MFRTEWFWMQEDVSTPLEEISPEQLITSAFQSFICPQENAMEVSTRKSHLPHFSNLLQCELSEQRLPEKLTKTKLK